MTVSPELPLSGEQSDATGQPGALLACAPAPGDEATPRGAAAAPVFYRIDTAKISLKEFRRAWRLPTALLNWFLFRFARVRVPVSADDPAVESLSPFVVPAEKITVSV